MTHSLLAVLSVPLVIWWEAFVISRVWNWHVAPGLHWPTLPLTVAAALSMIVTLVRFRYKKSDDLTELEKWERVMATPIVAAIVLAVGALLRLPIFK